MELKIPFPPRVEGEFFRSARIPLLAGVCACAAELLLSAYLKERTLSDSLARVLVAFLTIYLIHRFSLFALRSYRPRFKDQIALSAVMIGTLLMVSVGRLVANSLSHYATDVAFPGTNGMLIKINPAWMYYAIPYASGGVLMTAILGLQYGLVFGVSLAVILSLYFPAATTIGPFVIATTLVGCFSMVRFRSRSAYVKAGSYVAIVASVFAASAILMQGEFAVASAVMQIAAALLGGIFCGFVVGGVAPVLESLGGYVTDISLLEMATLDHPLLREMSVQAPGTWNHSMVMGMMSEAAAREIKANPVLARVGAYFHDIGKIKNPLYFIENQERGENRHDKLSSSMSALIIRSHVKDGIKLAKQERLPEAIIDMIPQHHGTSLIEYFYDKASKEVEESGGTDVDESHYRYPGPKPQTREAGILMLADGIEAACRTISEPTPDRIQGLVQKMINKVFASGELNECELTLKDLHSIAKSFTRVLTGIYHQRVQYAESAEKGTEREDEEQQKESEAGAENSSVTADPKQKSEAAGKRDKEGDKEDLKRLGIS